MKFTRQSKATWQGSGKEGKGTLTTPSGVLNKTPYTHKMRFGNDPGTNPEELIGAAHAGCFTMAFCVQLSEAGYTATNVDTSATVTFEDGMINHILLEMTGEVPGIDEKQFNEIAMSAKENCPISRSLRATIELKAKKV